MSSQRLLRRPEKRRRIASEASAQRIADLLPNDVFRHLYRIRGQYCMWQEHGGLFEMPTKVHFQFRTKRTRLLRALPLLSHAQSSVVSTPLSLESATLSKILRWRKLAGARLKSSNGQEFEATGVIVSCLYKSVVMASYQSWNGPMRTVSSSPRLQQ
jgi:hypothetical protein